MGTAWNFGVMRGVEKNAEINTNNNFVGMNEEKMEEFKEKMRKYVNINA